jgi:hypothetical protein
MFQPIEITFVKPSASRHAGSPFLKNLLHFAY